MATTKKKVAPKKPTVKKAVKAAPAKSKTRKVVTKKARQKLKL